MVIDCMWSEHEVTRLLPWEGVRRLNLAEGQALRCLVLGSGTFADSL